MRRAVLALTLLCGLFLTGCAGYKLGPTNGQEAGAKSIQVGAFVNQTLEPWLSDGVMAQLRKSLQHDGTYKLATHDDGDIIVTGVITDYHRREVSFEPKDTLTVKDYRVNIIAHVTARERATGKILIDQPVTGFTLVRVGNDLTSSERQALPLLAEDLANHITALLVDGSW
jgi:hypothetical protein